MLIRLRQQPAASRERVQKRAAVGIAQAAWSRTSGAVKAHRPGV